jgi:hypothetical protein
MIRQDDRADQGPPIASSSLLRPYAAEARRTAVPSAAGAVRFKAVAEQGDDRPRC